MNSKQKNAEYRRAIVFMNSGKYSEALPLFRRLVEEEYLDAFNWLGTAYLYGLGVRRNSKKALEIFLSGAALGIYDCEYNAAISLLSGTHKDKRRAFLMLQNGVKSQDRDAIMVVADCYRYGVGVAKDSKRAFKLYKKAARLGHVDSLFSLGVCFSQGIGTPPNPENAFDCFLKAAKKGHVLGCHNVSVYYARGEGVTVNTRAARIWKRKAEELAEAGY